MTPHCPYMLYSMHCRDHNLLCMRRQKRPSKLVSSYLGTSTGHCWTILNGSKVSPIPLVWCMSTSHLMQGQEHQKTPWLGLQTTLHERDMSLLFCLLQRLVLHRTPACILSMLFLSTQLLLHLVKDCLVTRHTCSDLDARHRNPFESFSLS